ncbi:MAG TPA: SusC/RagA family TonB-linked outer membrane protein [Balneolaceae bacterium]|nr:SusC/RagA family TonB-linked outer membrane protein [Balneolaceae bacterium]
MRLKNMRTLGTVLCLLLVMGFTNSVKAQENGTTVRGKVTDSKTGEVLPGVNILVKGTQRGTTTGVNGMYELTAPSQNDSLRFTFIGYQTKVVAINGRNTINVALKSTTIQGQQVVVTGYLTQSRNNVVSSVSTVNSKDLQQENTSNLSSMLQGRASGVYVSNSSGQPGQTPTVLIRGLGSISAGSSPLYVIDGVIASADDVNPNNVESVNVLKGPTATAIYGARAANGVIQITTKSGSPTNKTNFNVRVSSGTAKALKGNLYFMNGPQFLDYYHAAGHYAPDFADSTHTTDWWDLIYQNASIQKYHISASSGNETDQIYVSGEFYRNTSTRVGDDYKRFNARVNYTHKFSDKFTLDTKIHGHFVKQAQNATASGQVTGAAYRGVPWDNPYDQNGNIVKGVVGDNWLTRDIRNPLWSLQWDYIHNRTNHVSIEPELTYDITDYLTVTSRNHYSFADTRREEYRDRRTSYGGAENGALSNSNDYSDNLETSDLLTYKRTIGDHSINAVAGFEYQENDGWYFGAEGAGILNFDVLNLAATPYSVSGSKYKSVFVSQFLQMNYNYQRKYFLSGSVRRDGSSRFGSKNKYSSFYAIGGGWMLSNESFFNSDFIDQLKLRIGYGTTGNAQIGNYAAQSLQGYGVKYDGTPGSYPQVLGNTALTWEKQHYLQAGIDLKMLDSRIDITIDGYQKKNSGLLQSVPLPYESGFTSQLQNIGSVRNRGLEATISTTNIRSGDFLWTTSFNGTYNKNEVTDLYQENAIINGNQIIDIGSPMNTWYIPKWAGVNPQNGMPQWEHVEKDQNGNVQSVTLTNDYNKATYQKAGSSIPDWYGGITNTFQYKGLSLYLTFNYMGGYKVYSDIVQGGLSDGARFNYNQLDLTKYPNHTRWVNPGDNATEPAIKSGGNNLSDQTSTRYLYNGNHLRLQELRVSYSLPNKLLQQFNLNNVTIYMDGTNLWTLTAPDYIGPDPEEGLGGSEGGRSKYPNSRNFMFGIDLKF